MNICPEGVVKIIQGGSSEDPKDMVKVLPESIVGVLPEG